MKSVKNFFIERLHSIDNSDQPHKANCKTKDKTLCKSNDGNSTTSGNSVSGEESPTNPSLTAQTPSNDDSNIDAGDSTTTPSNVASPTDVIGDKTISSPFDFSTAAPLNTTTTNTTNTKPKNRRKISLPWGRQSSIAKNLGLSRQHTIDTPSSFRIFRQSSNKLKIGTHEATWVISDYIASPGSNELSVSKGQQVEIVEPPTANEPDFCVVRLNPQSEDAAVQEGIVPVSILKPPPGSQKTSSTRKDKGGDVIQDQTNNRSKPDSLTSSTKRRGLGGRKWLPQIGRKPTQNKVEKTPEKLLVKKLSEKNFKLPPKQVDDPNTSQLASTNTTSQLNISQQDFEAEEEVGLELPPPMKPIQEPHLISNGPPTFTKDLKDNPSAMPSTGKMDGLSEIEQIVKEKTEKHEEKSKIFSESNVVRHGSSVGAGGNSSSSSCSGVGGVAGGINTTENADFAYPNSESGVNKAENNGENTHTEASDIESVQKHRFPALAELLSTEEMYIKDLGDIVNGYIAELRNVNSEIPLPNDLKGPKGQIVFANIEAIYEWHRDYFLKALIQSQKTPTELGSMIKRYGNKFQMYITYCNNKPKSEHIVTEHAQYFDLVRQKLHHRLDLSDLLIKPVQRLTKYVLLLQTITKQIEQAGLVEDVPIMKEACNVMNAICKDVNDIMVLRRLKNFDGNITAQGKLLLHGPLTCIENGKNTAEGKMRELHVFLFEQGIFFTERHNSKVQFSSPTYIYRSHIQVNKMQLDEWPNNRFLLKSTDPNRPDLNMICYAATIDSHREWLDTIRKQLQFQNDFLNALIRPIAYQQQQQQQQTKHNHSELKHEHSREQL